MRGGASEFMRAPAIVVYSLVADVTRMGEWSPECYRCEWLDGASQARVGARFRGHNRSGLLRWSNESEIVAAKPGELLTWRMGPRDAPYAEWSYTFEEHDGGVMVAETFQSLRHTRIGMLSTMVMGGHHRVEKRLQTGVEATLLRLKAVAEIHDTPGMEHDGIRATPATRTFGRRRF